MPSLTSSARNRTTEFRTILASIAPAAATPPPANSSAKRSAFARGAAEASGAIAETSQKLAKLTALARRRTLFDDPSAEIHELTFVIKQDLGALNARLDDLKRLRARGRQTGDHEGSVVESLQGRLGAAAEGFKDVLKMRTESLAAQQERRGQFGGSGSAPFGATESAVALDLGGVSGGQSSSVGGVGGQMSLMRPPQDVSYQDARADAVRQVESTIVELGQIFNQLATMVTEQGEMVERIDANVDDTVSNIDAGHNQLIVYYNSISGNRALILKVFGTMLLFLILWSVIL